MDASLYFDRTVAQWWGSANILCCGGIVLYCWYNYTGESSRSSIDEPGIVQVKEYIEGPDGATPVTPVMTAGKVAGV